MTTAETLNIVAMDFAEIEVRVIALFGQPWFVGADLRRVLATADAGSFYRGLGSDETMDAPANSIRALNSARDALAHGTGLKRAKLVSESGLYKLVMRSEKPEAKPFQEWVTREVLPAIRRTGGYRLQGVAPDAVEEGTVSEMPDVAAFLSAGNSAQWFQPGTCRAHRISKRPILDPKDTVPATEATTHGGRAP